ncbi:SDR family oxidoreductase [Streptomyces sp. NPDC048172]|uniref:SDR family oxidoreductase n=1 Tax=Streptomyces sp. NPDC048172 TaxID=3365505 RepID=UPI0037210198
MILLTGATGTIGGHVLRLLTAGDTPSVPVRAMVRDPSRLTPPPGAHVDVVRGDFDEPGSLREALEGVTDLFLATVAGPAVAAHDTAAVEAAEAAGVRRVVKLSAIRVPGVLPRVAEWHAPGERALRESGMAWTLLQPAGFASNSLQWAGAVRAGNPVPNTTGTGRQAVIDPRDVAEAAVAALLSPRGSGHEGRSYVLTGPEPLSVPEQVARIGRLLGPGRDPGCVDVPPAAAAGAMRGAGMSEEFVGAALEGMEMLGDGRGEILGEGVREALGRPARPFDTWVRDHLDAFTGSRTGQR